MKFDKCYGERVRENQQSNAEMIKVDFSRALNVKNVLRIT